MNFTDLILDIEDENVVYENDYMKVLKILHEIKTTRRSKRLQLVVWKNKKTDVPDIDLRNFDLVNNSYGKGITFSIKEFKEIAEVFMEFKENYE